jgi:plastocyanin
MKKIIFPLIAVAFLITGCGTAATKSANQPAAKTQPPATRTIDISNSTFQPATITVNAGDTIVWTNRDSLPHSIKGQSFSSSPLPPNGTYQLTLAKPGTFDYNCSLHPNMKGQIIVQ